MHVRICGSPGRATAQGDPVNSIGEGFAETKADCEQELSEESEGRARGDAEVEVETFWSTRGGFCQYRGWGVGGELVSEWRVLPVSGVDCEQGRGFLNFANFAVFFLTLLAQKEGISEGWGRWFGEAER